MTEQPNGKPTRQYLMSVWESDIEKEDFWTLTSKVCSHCKKTLSKFEYAVNRKEWNRPHKHHYCCYSCFQRNHI